MDGPRALVVPGNGRFYRSRVGVTPETILRAWGFPVAGDFEETLKRYQKLKPDPEKVKQYARYISVNWDERFGRRRDDNGDGDTEDEPSEEGGDGDGD